MGRLNDFVSLLRAIVNDKLCDNIALHLLLNVGAFYGQTNISQVRYSKDSLSFWMTVQKLFKGRGINFFRGFKGQGLARGTISPDCCRINFLVPSDPVLQREGKESRLDASKPDIISQSLQAFSDLNKGKYVSLFIDGEKVASEFGQLGEEDLCGFETKTNLSEREERHAEE